MSATTTEVSTARGVTLRWSLGVLLLAAAALVVALVVGGGAPQRVPAGLPDPGPLTGWGLPVARTIADLAGLTTLGLLLAAGLLLPSSTQVLTRPGFAGTQLAVRTAMLWAAAVAVEIVLTISDFFAFGVDRALDPTTLRSFLTQVPQGRALGIQLLLALLLAGLSRSVIAPGRAALASGVALVALVPPALTGHSAASGNHDLAVSSLVVHVVAASLWVGGLVALVWLGVVPRSDQRDHEGLGLALTRFSALALVCWATVGVSGVVNAAVRLGSVGELVGSSYGALVLAKATAFVALGGFGWWHRRHSVDQLRRTPSSRPVFVRVAAVEVVVMAATVGLAVALSRTPTPVGEISEPSRAYELLGFALPPAPDTARLLLGWQLDGFAIALLALLGLSYAAGLRTLRRRGDHWPVGRTLSWYAGLLVVAWTTVGGLGLYSHVLFSAHMVAHMTLSMIAPIGLVLGAPVTLALRSLPGRRTPKELGLRQLLQQVLHSRLVRVLSHPLVAAGLFVISLYALYFSGLFAALMSNHLGHAAMELHFLAVGSLFFWVLIGVDPAPRRIHALARIGLLLVVMPFHAFFAIALMNTDRVLAPLYYGALDRPYSTDLLADQHLGGAISWALGEVPIVLLVAAIFVQWFRSDRRESRRLDRREDAARDTGESEHERYNAWLASLAEHESRRSRG